MTEFEELIIEKLNEIIKIQSDTLEFFLKTNEEITGDPSSSSSDYINELKRDNFFPSGG